MSSIARSDGNSTGQSLGDLRILEYEIQLLNPECWVNVQYLRVLERLMCPYERGLDRLRGRIYFAESLCLARFPARVLLPARRSRIVSESNSAA